MLSSITPLGERGRRSRYFVTLAFFVVGAGLGGALLGLVGGTLGRLTPSPGGDTMLLLASLVVALAGLLEIPQGPSPPSIRRQVNENWLHRYRGWFYGAGFGFQLGTGLSTIVTSWAVYATVVLTVIAPSIAVATALGAWFGVTRALTIFVGARAQTGQQLVELHRRLSSMRAPARRRLGGALLIVGLVIPMLTHVG